MLFIKKIKLIPIHRNACEIGYGVCQDHTHILISVARELGFPARYVSGYMNLNNSRELRQVTHGQKFLMILDG